MVGKSDDWYLNDFNLGDDLLEAKDHVIDPIQSFVNGPQRTIYDDAAALLTTHTSNLNYLPSGSDEAINAALADPNAFRGNKMAQLRQATDALRGQIDSVVADNRAAVASALERRRSELVDTAYYAARPHRKAQRRAVQRIDQTLARIATENQVALIQQIGSNFESSEYPGLLDLCGIVAGHPSPDPEPVKQTVSVKTVEVAGASGVRDRGRRRQLPDRPAQRTPQDAERRKANHPVMETAPLRNFATWARASLIREVTARVAAVLAPGSSERVEEAKAVAALERAVIAAGGGDKGRCRRGQGRLRLV